VYNKISDRQYMTVSDC